MQDLSPPPLMTLRQMEVFHAIMVAGSVTGAARHLNITQPAVSTVLRHCEDRLQMALFVRTGGRLEPTHEARALFPDIAAIFSRIEAVGRMTRDLAGGRLGVLSIAAAFPIANGIAAEAVATFVESRPHVRCSLQSLTSPQVVDRVINGEVDLGIAHEPMPHPAIGTEMLMTWRLACLVRDDHPLAGRAKVAFQDIAPYRIFTYLPQIMFRPYIDRALSQSGVSLDIAVQISIALTGIALARHGSGVAIVDPLLINSMGISGLAILPLDPAIEASTLLVRSKSSPPSLVLDEFVTHLKRLAQQAR